MISLQILSVQIKKLEDAILNSPINYSYIIMSDETLKIMASQLSLSSSARTRTYSEIYGIPIAICNKLKVGEVELFESNTYKLF